MINRLKKYLWYSTSSLSRFFQRVARYHWHNYPFGTKPRASREEYLRLSYDVQYQSYPEIEEFESSTGFSISLDWLHDLALHTQIVIKQSPLCYAHGRILYSALSRYLRNHEQVGTSNTVTIWETGTARGFSALCMAKAMHDFGASGKIITFDVLPHDKPMYWNCIDDLERPKSRAELLQPWRRLVENYVIFFEGDSQIEMSKVKLERINFAFLDGTHTYSAVMSEFDQIRDSQVAGDVVVFDDYTEGQFPGLVEAVDEICHTKSYDKKIIRAGNSRGYVVATKN